MKAIAIAATILATATAGWAGDLTISGAAGAAYTHAESGGASANEFGGGGAVLVALSNPGLDLQFAAGGSRASGGGVDVNSWVADADVFWRDRKGTFGASVGHGSVGAFGSSADVTGYGVFGEWYASRRLTLRFNGGGFGGDAEGWFGSGGAKFYADQDLGISFEYDFIHPTSWFSSNLNSANIGVEYLFSESLPLSVGASYAHVWTSGADANTFGIALRYRFGTGGPLVALDRNGPASWTATSSLMRAW